MRFQKRVPLSPPPRSTRVAAAKPRAARRAREVSALAQAHPGPRAAPGRRPALRCPSGQRPPGPRHRRPHRARAATHRAPRSGFSRAAGPRLPLPAPLRRNGNLQNQTRVSPMGAVVPAYALRPAARRPRRRDPIVLSSHFSASPFPASSAAIAPQRPPPSARLRSALSPPAPPSETRPPLSLTRPPLSLRPPACRRSEQRTETPTVRREAPPSSLQPALQTPPRLAPRAFAPVPSPLSDSPLHLISSLLLRRSSQASLFLRPRHSPLVSSVRKGTVCGIDEEGSSRSVFPLPRDPSVPFSPRCQARLVPDVPSSLGAAGEAGCLAGAERSATIRWANRHVPF